MLAFLAVACGMEQISVARQEGSHREEIAPAIDSNTAPASGAEKSGIASEASAKNPTRIGSLAAGRNVTSPPGGGSPKSPGASPAGACVSFQAVTCTVYLTDHQTECLGASGTWRLDANCFDRNRAPLAGCELMDSTEWFFSMWPSGAESERIAAEQACANLGGKVLP